MIAVNGKAKINPGIPQSNSPQSNASIATIGFILTLDPTTKGVMKLALPLTAVMKVIFDSIPSLEPYGFLLGEAPARTKETKAP